MVDPSVRNHWHVTGGIEDDPPVLAVHLREQHDVDPDGLADPVGWHRAAHVDDPDLTQPPNLP